MTVSILATSPPRGLRGFIDGAACFFEGLRFLVKNPRYLPVVIVPFLLTIGVFFITFWLALYGFASWKDWFFEDKTAWYWTWTGAEYLLWLLFFVIYAAVCFFGFLVVGSLITSPFSEYLSQQVELAYPPPDAPPGGGARFLLADVLRGLKHEVLRLALYAGVWLACLPLLLVPLLGQAAFAAAMIYLNVRYLAWDGLDYCMSRRRMRFRDKLALLRGSRARTTGYGALSFMLLAIPFTTLFVLPLNAVGGSILFCRIRREGGSSPAPRAL
ncbi:MAG: EI24 domain-containing protein [Planctomycetota bacterium]